MVKDLPEALVLVHDNIASTVPLILSDENASNEDIEKRITTVAVEAMSFASSAKMAAAGFLKQSADGNGKYPDFAKQFFSNVERYFCLLMIKTAVIRLPEIPKAKAEAYEVAIEENNTLKNSPQKFPAPFTDAEIQDFLSKVL